MTQTQGTRPCLLSWEGLIRGACFGDSMRQARERVRGSKLSVTVIFLSLVDNPKLFLKQCPLCDWPGKTDCILAPGRRTREPAGFTAGPGQAGHTRCPPTGTLARRPGEPLDRSRASWLLVVTEKQGGRGSRSQHGGCTGGRCDRAGPPPGVDRGAHGRARSLRSPTLPAGAPRSLPAPAHARRGRHPEQR